MQLSRRAHHTTSAVPCGTETSGLPGQWYAIQTRVQHERAVASAISDKGMESFLPTSRRRQRFRGSIREVAEPLFPGYVFGRFDVNRRLPVLVTPGVRQIVGCGKVPVAVDDREIDALRLLASSDRMAEPWPFLRVGQWVRINQGAMEDLEGILVEVRKKHRLIVSVSLLERSVAVDVDDTWVTPIPARDSRTAVPA